MGNGNYFYVYEGVTEAGAGFGWFDLAINYFGLSAVSSISSAQCAIISSPNISVAETYAIDKKSDDGMPQSGNIMALYENGDSDIMWCDGTNASRTSNPWPAINTGAIPASPTSCYDNGGNAGAITEYSMGYSNGNGGNCALSFRMKSGD